MVQSHLLKKLGWGIPDSGGMASGSRCCTGHLCGTSSGWVCRMAAGFLGVFIGVLAAGTAGCGLGVAGATGGAAAGAADAGLTGNIPGEDSGIAGATSVLTGVSGLTASR